MSSMSAPETCVARLRQVGMVPEPGGGMKSPCERRLLLLLLLLVVDRVAGPPLLLLLVFLLLVGELAVRADAVGERRHRDRLHPLGGQLGRNLFQLLALHRDFDRLL